MNSSQNIHWLKRIQTASTNIENALTNNLSSYPFQNGLTLNNIYAELQTIDTSLDNIESDMTGTNKQGRIFFHSLLEYDGNNYLNKADYTSSPITGFYHNTSANTQYITQFHFSYEHSSNEPTGAEMYHSTAFATKIGKANPSNVFEAPFMTLNNNYEQADENQKNSQYNPQVYDWNYNFEENPIELGVTSKFAHYIAGDFSGADYGSNPVGYVRGYYKTS